MIYHKGPYVCGRGRTHDGQCRGRLRFPEPRAVAECRCQGNTPGQIDVADPLCPFHRGYMPTSDVASPGLP